MGSFLDGMSTLWGGKGNAGAASSNAWNYGQYSPFTINNPMGSIGWNGTSGTATLSPFQQQLQGAFGGAVNSGLQQPQWLQGQYNNIFSPGAFQQGVNDQFGKSVSGIMPFLQQASQSNRDNEFSKGTLASTAGSYQTAGQNMATGGILSNLYNTAFGNQLGLANSQFGAAGNTAGLGMQGANLGLSGMGQQNQALLQMLQAGGNLGAQRSGANVAAATPGIETGMVQDNSTAGLLSGLLFGGGSTGGLLNGLLGGSGSGTNGLTQLLGKAGTGIANLFGRGGGGGSGVTDSNGYITGLGGYDYGQMNQEYGNPTMQPMPVGDVGEGHISLGDYESGAGNNWWGDSGFSSAGGEAAQGAIHNLGVSDVGGLSSEVQRGINGASTGNVLGKSGLLGDASSALGIINGLQRGGVKGDVGAALSAGKLYNDVIGHSQGFQGALGAVGGALNIYNGITSGTPQGYTSAALSAAQLGAHAGAFGSASAGIGAAAGAVALPAAIAMYALSTPAYTLNKQHYADVEANLDKSLAQMAKGPTVSQYGQVIDSKSLALANLPPSKDLVGAPKEVVNKALQLYSELGIDPNTGAGTLQGTRGGRGTTSNNTKA